jgi:hypothetical protein
VEDTPKSLDQLAAGIVIAVAPTDVEVRETSVAGKVIAKRAFGVPVIVNLALVTGVLATVKSVAVADVRTPVFETTTVDADPATAPIVPNPKSAFFVIKIGVKILAVASAVAVEEGETVCAKLVAENPRATRAIAKIFVMFFIIFLCFLDCFLFD